MLYNTVAELGAAGENLKYFQKSLAVLLFSSYKPNR